MNRRGGAHIPLRRRPLIPTPQDPPVLQNGYEASPADCAEVKRTVSEATNFPPELVDIIMDFAEYWACSVTSIDYTVLPARHLAIRGARAGENKLLLRTEPLGLTKWHPHNDDLWRSQASPRPLLEEYSRAQLESLAEGPISTLEHPIRKVVFNIKSRDQGHGGDREDHYTYRYSWTWFDAGIDRFDAKNICGTDCTDDKPETEGSSDDAPQVPTCAIRPVWPPIKEDASYDHALHATPDHLIQRNRLADKNWQQHHIEWSWTDDIDPESTAGEDLEKKGRGSATGNGDSVRSLKVGDMITVWGRARFMGWSNNIEKVEVQVYWAL
ncbi:Uu.00g117720.m01.CDS01 [Anthostomella pinea]|uniref:Uu.00g117720.m01.CDS01 n=1 Tax=Anthostomella pinea TaxID=933095 RepID=A0AAI8YEJ2_9PEZI|nr:Uu.00g117720.m01.CDS01 [Anthostomella pinea]